MIIQIIDKMFMIYDIRAFRVRILNPDLQNYMGITLILKNN